MLKEDVQKLHPRTPGGGRQRRTLSWVEQELGGEEGAGRKVSRTRWWSVQDGDGEGQEAAGGSWCRAGGDEGPSHQCRWLCSELREVLGC